MFTNVILFCNHNYNNKKPVWNNIDFLVVFLLRTEFQYTHDDCTHFYWSNRKKRRHILQKSAYVEEEPPPPSYQREEEANERDTIFRFIKPVL